MVTAHNVAYGVGVHLVKAAFGHVLVQLLRAGPVGVGQVSHGQLAALGAAGVAVAGQAFLPVPQHIALRGLAAKLVTQADFHYAVDIAQALLQFNIGMVLQTPRKGLQDVALGQPGTARSAHGQNKGPAKLGLVVAVELLNMRQFLRRAVG